MGGRGPGLGGPSGLLGGPPELLQMVIAQRPELGERLQKLAERARGRLPGLLREALLLHFEQVLDDAEHALERPETMPAEPMPPEGPPGLGPPPFGLHRPPGFEGMPPELRGRIRELEQKQGELERRAQELARQVREARDRHPDAPDAAKDQRAELNRVVGEQFEVRTALRKLEVERIGRELKMMREALERVQKDLQEREAERGSIVERRVKQLLGEDASDW